MKEKRALAANIRERIKKHLRHFILRASILSLRALLIWWSIFINQANENQRTLNIQNLRESLNLIATKLETDLIPLPGIGIYKEDQQKPCTL